MTCCFQSFASCVILNVPLIILFLWCMKWNLEEVTAYTFLWIVERLIGINFGIRYFMTFIFFRNWRNCSSHIDTTSTLLTYGRLIFGHFFSLFGHIFQTVCWNMPKVNLDWSKICENDSFTAPSRIYYRYTEGKNTNSIKLMSLSNSVSTRIW